MTTVLKVIRRTFNQRTVTLLRQFHRAPLEDFKIRPMQIISVIGGTVALYTIYKATTSQSLKALKLKNVSTRY